MATRSGEPATGRGPLRTLEVDALRARLASGPALALVDVREPDEFAAGRLPGAVSIPRGRLAREVVRRFPERTTPLVVYCARGPRAALAAATLVELGYEQVEHVSSGFERWREAGFPVEASADAAGEGGRLSAMQRARYGRHLALPEIGEDGQARLLASRVLVLGAGGLGSPAALYLAAAGVGTIGVADPDVVELSNLQRQILHGSSRLGRPKVESAARSLTELNPEVVVLPFAERVERTNVERILGAFDVVVDGCDDFATRYLVSDASVWLGVPVVHGSIHRFEGQVTTFVPREGPCYRCLYPAPPPPRLAPSCAAAGVLGVLPGVIGTLQATEALKLLLGQGEPLVGRLVCYDALAMRFRELCTPRDPDCPVCGEQPTITEYADYARFCADDSATHA